MKTLVEEANSSLVKKILMDFHEGSFLVRMRGEGRFRSSVFPEFSNDRGKVLLEFVPSEKVARPPLLLRWLVALRLPYLLLSLLPVVLVAANFSRSGQSFPWISAALLVLSISLLHISCNFWGEAEDHLRGIDLPERSGGSGVIRNLWISAKQLRLAASAFFALAFLAGIFLLLQLPLRELALDVFLLGLIGALGAASYSGWPFHYKYVGLGEPIVFFLSGPLVVVGAALVFYQSHEHFLFLSLASLPLSFLAMIRLHGGNMQRIPFDSMAGVFTLARAWGFNRSKWVMAFLLGAPFLLLLGLWLGNIAPTGAFACALALPHAVLAGRKMKQCMGPLDPECEKVRALLGQFHFLFGVTYCVSFFF